MEPALPYNFDAHIVLTASGLPATKQKHAMLHTVSVKLCLHVSPPGTNFPSNACDHFVHMPVQLDTAAVLEVLPLVWVGVQYKK